MARTLGSGRKPIHPDLIDNKKYKKSPQELKALKERIPTIKSCKLTVPQELTDGAKKEWRRVVTLYKELAEPILNDLDAELLKSYCIAVDIRTKLYEEYNRISKLCFESVTTTKHGVVEDGGKIKKPASLEIRSKVSPLLRELRQFESRITILGSELGLTPAGRVARGIKEAKEKSDPLDSFYNDLNKKEE